jgi:hypothetical protein
MPASVHDLADPRPSRTAHQSAGLRPSLHQRYRLGVAGSGFGSMAGAITRDRIERRGSMPSSGEVRHAIFGEAADQVGATAI